MRAIFTQVKLYTENRKELRQLKKWTGKVKNLTQKPKATVNQALVQWAEFKERKVIDVLKFNKERNHKLRQLGEICQKNCSINLMKRVVRDIVECYVIQPKLDAIADCYVLKKNLVSFKAKTSFLREKRLGLNLDECEIKSYQALAFKLMSKAFTSIKLANQCSQLKSVQEQMVREYQWRKWFAIWRQNYLIKSQNNYFVA